MNKRIYEQIKEWTNELTNKWMNARTNEWIEECMNK